MPKDESIGYWYVFKGNTHISHTTGNPCSGVSVYILLQMPDTLPKKARVPGGNIIHFLKQLE